MGNRVNINNGNYNEHIEGDYIEQKMTSNTSFQDEAGNTISSQKTLHNDNGNISISSSNSINGEPLGNKFMEAINTLAEAAGGRGLPAGIAQGLRHLFATNNITSNTNSQTVVGNNNQAIQQSTNVYHQSGNIGIGHMSGGTVKKGAEISGKKVTIKNNVLHEDNQQIVIGDGNQTIQQSTNKVVGVLSNKPTKKTKSRQTVLGNNNQVHQSSSTINSSRQSIFSDVSIGGDFVIGNISQNYEEVEKPKAPVSDKKSKSQQMKEMAELLLQQAKIEEKEEEALKDFWDE